MTEADPAPSASPSTPDGGTPAGESNYTWSHGVRKGERRRLDNRELASYLSSLEREILSNRTTTDKHSLLAKTTDYLRRNPEHYTVWNVRRECLAFLNDESVLSGELPLLQKILMRYPKTYTLWEHRKWVLGSLVWPDFDGELLLVSKLLERDGRNYHVWQYRRWVVAMAEKARGGVSMGTKELEYTTAAVTYNFSNFSAWHARRFLLPITRDRVVAELELLRHAIYTDPGDRSIWLYHRWLVCGQRDGVVDGAMVAGELAMVDELLEEDDGGDAAELCTTAKITYAWLHLHLTHTLPSADQVAELQSLKNHLATESPAHKARIDAWHPETAHPAWLVYNHAFAGSDAKVDAWGRLVVEKEGAVVVAIGSDRSVDGATVAGESGVTHVGVVDHKGDVTLVTLERQRPK
ncbi:Rab geranylgeranyltransferase [Savitreella phatthalungensis]